MIFEEIINFIRSAFNTPQGLIQLHTPYFAGNERKYVLDTLDSTFVSSVGAYVNRFEEMMVEITGAKFAVATVNGTTALHLALILADVNQGDEVITQSLTFVATANAISFAGGIPVFVDVDKDTMGLSPSALRNFLASHTEVNAEGICINKVSGRKIAACIPMHTFGFPLRIDEIKEICDAYNIKLIEDAAESLGSYYKGKHTGSFGLLGTFSFNGNKIVTCGAGGAIVTNDEKIAKRAKHLSTTAKVPHQWEFMHDEVGYNYRLPNITAALACAQLERLDSFVENKRELAATYKSYFDKVGVPFITEIEGAKANFWLNALLMPNLEERNTFLKMANDNQVMCRPIWRLMNKLPMYQHCQTDSLENAGWLEERVVNIPSSVRF
ncbi:aminotransferase in exopolysaccharide biosynthesis [Chitinophaga niastensis]|uniref:GDP-perosamine synthase n=1 Tax=Chitinophaga niastensis TaxID=536980 RepID=A0A2P8HRY0_CHINA|nr:LegC family aminotransferase [Chitinophaga niastensis]PSL48955.1 aminotransferase in exopolysaccharide biosynthesis [Chitinophaga niastensis]